MKSTAEENRLGRPRPARSGFSLAELMIALAILAMGLLVIGAALPIGVRYTQQSAEIDTGAAAAEYALDLVEQSLVLCYSTTDLDKHPVRSPVIFQPRYPLTKGLFSIAASSSSSSSSSSGASSVSGTGGVQYGSSHPGSVNLSWEPLIKVRPLFTDNVLMDGTSYLRNPSGYVDIEQVIKRLVGTPTAPTMEYDLNGISPALPCTAVVYPPIATRKPGTGNNTVQYYPNDLLSGWDKVITVTWEPNAPELKKLMERRTVWTAFYRRVSYAGSSDPALYEIIVVVSRRPTENHRFAVQNGNGNYAYMDTLAPIPWLGRFTGLPTPPGGFDANSGDPLGLDRVLTFKCAPDSTMSRLLPVGAIFIPARNDVAPSSVTSGTYYGLGPVAPNVLPIYRVVDRPDTSTVIVENNGFYPVVKGSSGYVKADNMTACANWPVWVIPPAFAKYDNGGEPLYEGESSILTVARRYVYVHEAN